MIGIDISTSLVKSIVFTRDGQVISEYTCSYSTYRPKSSYAEQSPHEVEHATRAALKHSIKQQNINISDIIGITFSSPMHSLICINEENDPISPMLTWEDKRSYSQAGIMKESYGRGLYEQTGTPIHPMSPFVKLVWMKEANYPPYYQSARFVSIKEYILYKWCGTWQVDISTASATGLLDLHTLKWNSDALTIAGINESQLSTLVPCTHQLEALNTSIADEIGVSKATPIIIGATNGVHANIGIGATGVHDTALSIGTSSAIRRFTNEHVVDLEQRTFQYAFTESLRVVGGASNNGMSIMHWLARQFSSLTKKETIEIMDLEALAANSSAGANGLFFLPYLSGERAPKWNAKAKGGWLGLTLTHTSADMIRSAMEGVIFNMYEIYDSISGNYGMGSGLVVSGSYADSTLWVQMTADIFRKTVKLPSTEHATAWGAAWLGLMALGKVNTLEEIKDFIKIKHEVFPNVRSVVKYEEHYELYREIYNKNKPLYNDIDRLQY